MSENVSTTDAKRILYARLIDGWTATPIMVDGEGYSPVSDQAWVWVGLLDERSRLNAIRGVGKRPFRREATFRIQHRGPLDGGTINEDLFVESMKALFEGVNIGGIHCNDCSVRPPRSDGPWRLRTVEFDVWYVERR